MLAWFTANLAPIMFCSLIVFLLIGFPVAFSLGAVGLAYAVVGIEVGAFQEDFLQALPQRVFGNMANETLLAVPFFTFMGLILERSGMAEDLLDTIGQLFGPVRGGLAYAVVFVGALLAATTGVVAASVISMGLISLPIMLRYGYQAKTATGVIAATGTITQLVPPSLTLLVLADQLGKPVGDMYAGAIGPSLAQTLVFILYIAVLSLVRPQWVPPLPPGARTLRGWALARRVVAGVVPALGLIFLVLGTIFLGLATATEAGAMGAVGAMFLAALRGRLTRQLIWQGMETTMRLTAMVIFILVGATVFSLVFQGVYGPHWVESLLGELPGGQVGFLVVVSLFVFVLAFFLDFFEIAFIIVPLLAPVAQKLGIDLIWFGVLLCVLLQTSFMHPPFGFALFYLRGITPPKIRTSEIYWGALPWVGLQLFMVALVIALPQLVTLFFEPAAAVDMQKAGKDVLQQIERALDPGAQQ
jgi:tripartite ATP-independent transporter DctM subunit